MVSNNFSSTPASLRRTHRGLVVSRIQAEPGISRADLARSFGFSEMAATRIVRDLLGAGIIEEFGLPNADSREGRRIGRPKIGLRIIPDGIYAAGITVSAYYSEVSICDANGGTVACREVDNGVFEDAPATARLYSDALLSLIEDTGVDSNRIVGVGIALSATTSPDRTEGLHSEYFGWSSDGGQFWSEIRETTQLPVVIENIANALAISEMRFGVARDVSDFALVHVATFAGAGVISDGQVLRGASGEAGRIGHLRATDTPLRCTCGRSDCVNLSATGFSILANLGMLDHTAFDQLKVPLYARALVDAVVDRANVGPIDRAGRQLAHALDPVTMLFAPEMIIMSGVLGADERYFGGAENELAAVYGYGPDSPYRLVRGQVTPSDAAALLALHTFCYSDRLDFERLNGSAVAEVEKKAYA